MSPVQLRASAPVFEYETHVQWPDAARIYCQLDSLTWVEKVNDAHGDKVKQRAAQLPLDGPRELADTRSAMSGKPAKRARFKSALGRLAAIIAEGPPCAICGRGRATTDWLADPMGGIHGRCPGCIDDGAGPARQARTEEPRI